MRTSERLVRERITSLKAKLEALHRKGEALQVVLLCVGQGASFDLDRLPKTLPAGGHLVAVDGRYTDPAKIKCDLLINIGKVFAPEEHYLRAVRDHSPDTVIVHWSNDNHHDELFNIRISLQADIVFAAHSFCQGYFIHELLLLLGHLPLGFIQWSAARAARLFDLIGGGAARHSDLAGGFIEHSVGLERNRLVRDVMRHFPSPALHMIPAERCHEYYDRTPEQRFAEWAAAKVVFCPAIRNDLSHRVFDSLICGAIPLVPDTTIDLDRVFSREQQAELPIIRFQLEGGVGAVREAFLAGLESFDVGGYAGVVRRHRCALEGHSLELRVNEIVARLHSIARGGRSIQIGTFPEHEDLFGAIADPLW